MNEPDYKFRGNVYAMFRHDGWVPSGTDPEILPLHMGCGFVASLLTLLIVLSRHSMGAVSVLVGSCCAIWFSITYRAIGIGEKTSPAYIAAWGVWLIWTIIGLLWSRSEYETEDDGWIMFLYCNILLPLLAMAVTTRMGYTSGELQTAAYITLWIGIIFSETGSHAYGTHAQLSHVIGAAFRVLTFFMMFIFIYYYRVELPYGETPPFRYTEQNRYNTQDRTCLILVGWILLAQWLTISIFCPLMITVYVFTMKKLAKKIKTNTATGKILKERYCSCGNHGSKRDIEAGMVVEHISEVSEKPVVVPTVYQKEIPQIKPKVPPLVIPKVQSSPSRPTAKQELSMVSSSSSQWHAKPLPEIPNRPPAPRKPQQEFHDTPKQPELNELEFSESEGEEDSGEYTYQHYDNNNYEEVDESQYEYEETYDEYQDGQEYYEEAGEGEYGEEDGYE